MLISLIMQIAQSMQISIRHFLTPQTIFVTFPLKNLAVKNISGLVCLASGLALSDDRVARKLQDTICGQLSKEVSELRDIVKARDVKVNELHN